MLINWRELKRIGLSTPRGSSTRSNQNCGFPAKLNPNLARLPYSRDANPWVQWRRSVVKYGGHGQLSSHQTVSGASKNNSFTFHFDTSPSALMMWILQSYSATVLNERMWHFRGVKTYSDTSYIFSGVMTPKPQDLRPCPDICYVPGRDSHQPQPVIGFCVSALLCIRTCTGVGVLLQRWV